MSTSQNIYAIKDRAPEFPCWAYRSEGGWFWFEQHGSKPSLLAFTHWSPDAPEAPKAIPSLPASPELPESVYAAVSTLKEADEMHLGRCASSEPFTARDYRNHACEARSLVRKAVALLTTTPSTPTPSPVAGLPTPETDAVNASLNGNLLDFARSLERRLAAARVEVERLEKQHDVVQAQIVLPASIPKSWMELAEENTSLRSDLAKANAAVEEAKRERDEAYKVISDLRLGPPGGKPVSNELKAHLNELSEQAYERASKKGNLEP